MDAFDMIFDAAASRSDTGTMTPRQKKGRAAAAMQPAQDAPAPNTNPAKAGRPATYEANTIVQAPVATHPADKAGDGETVVRLEPAKQSSRHPTTKTSRANRVTDSVSAMRAKKGGGQTSGADHISDAASHIHSDGDAIGDDRLGQALLETHVSNAEAVVIIVASWKMRQRWHKAEKSLILQSKAICRGFCDGDKDAANAIFDAAWKNFKAARKGKEAAAEVPDDVLMALSPFLPALARFEDERSAIEKSICKLAKTVPAYGWATSQPGIDKSFAWIVGEAGDIGSYKSVSALWKRMGLAVFGGERQRKKANADEALLHGYNPSRRSTMWNVGGALIGSMGRGPRPAPGEDISVREDWSYWQRLFIERCRYECARDPEKFPLKIVDKGDEQRESYSKHCQARAKRYVEKRFLRKLYAQWRLETLGASGDPKEIALPMAAE